jgi:hypothetical protein
VAPVNPHPTPANPAMIDHRRSTECFEEHDDGSPTACGDGCGILPSDRVLGFFQQSPVP